MQVVVGHMLPDGVRRGKAAVGHDALHVRRIVELGGQEHGRRAHGDARQIDRQRIAAARVDPGHPVGQIQALEHAEADVVPLALALAALIDVEHMAVLVAVEVLARAEVAVPRGTPAVYGEDHPLRAGPLEPVADELFPVVRRDAHTLMRAVQQALLIRHELRVGVLPLFQALQQARDQLQRSRLRARRRRAQEIIRQADDPRRRGEGKAREYPFVSFVHSFPFRRRRPGRRDAAQNSPSLSARIFERIIFSL